MFSISDKNQESDQVVSPTSDGGSSPAPAGAPVPQPMPMTSTVPALQQAMTRAESDNPASGNILPSDSNLPNTNITSEPYSIIQAGDSSNVPNPAAVTVPEDELINLKQRALQSLAPMLDHLDQTPEERFRTTMMLIQATDNAKLVREAYDAANQIKDEKVRAQALLDIVNEINYFTHPAR